MLPWLSFVVAAVAAAAGWARVMVERGRNKVLRDQLKLAEEGELPKVRVLEIRPTGGGTNIDFTAVLDNIGGRQVRALVTARVRDQVLYREQHDVLVNVAPLHVSFHVPRPGLGELMKECGHVTTLYGETLTVTVNAEGQTVEKAWSEEIFDPETDRERHAIQQRYWRQGGGKETEADRRAAWRSEQDEKRNQS